MLPSCEFQSQVCHLPFKPNCDQTVSTRKKQNIYKDPYFTRFSPFIKVENLKYWRNFMHGNYNILKRPVQQVKLSCDGAHVNIIQLS